MNENPNNSMICRRSIRMQQSTGGWDCEFLAHISRYERAASLMIELAKDLERPLRVLDIGCGEMWPLRTLVSGFWVAKPSVLKSYLGIDIEQQKFDFIGPKLRSKIAFNFLQRDLTIHSQFPVQDHTIDFAMSLESLEHMAPRFVRLWLNDLQRCMAPEGQIFISTPNKNYGREQPQYHADYEWNFDDLDTELRSRWEVKSCFGIYIRRNVFKKVNHKHNRIPPSLVETLKNRFGPNWFRNVVAAPYPEYAENVGWILRT